MTLARARIRNWLPLGTLALVVAGAGCSSDPAGTGGGAARLLLAGAPTSARSGIAFDPAPEVQLADASGNAVAQRGVLVTATLAEGSGSILAGAEVRTDADGRAVFSALAVQGPVGAKRVRFSSSGLGAALTGSIELAAGNPTGFTPVSGTNLTGDAGVAVTTAPSLRVTDAAGNPVPGIEVVFTVTGGGGTVTGATVTTGPDGIAAVGGWTLGAVPGANQLTAASPALPGIQLQFSATGVLGAPHTITVLEGDGQSAVAGTALAGPIKVKVTDRAGNVIPGVRVTFAVAAGGGSVGGGTPLTDAQGVALLGAWQLGPEPGENRLSATVLGVAPVTLTATGQPVPVTILQGNNQRAFVGDTLRLAIVVRITTGNGTARPNVPVTFTVTSGGGAFSESTVVSDAGGVAFTWWILGTAPGPNSAGVSAPQSASVELTAVGIRLVAMSAAFSSVCGLDSTGDTWCWGNNQFAQLGNGTTTSPRLRPTQVVGGKKFARLTGAGGGNFHCAQEASNLGYCWGSDWHGQLGDGSSPTGASSFHSAPIAIAGAVPWAQLRAGGDHACALDVGGQAWCWGRNFWGEVGDGTSGGDVLPPTLAAVGMTFASISPGASHTCALTPAGAAWCWGNRSGYRGGAGQAQPTPIQVPGGVLFTSLASGMASTCGLTSAGVAYCWGGNANGQQGNGTTTGSITPLPVSGGLVFTSLHALALTTCGLLADGTAWCWGKNDLGEAGVGHTSPVLTPTPVAGGLRFTTLAVGGAAFCGLTAGGVPWCWGPNDQGQVGDGTRTMRLVPTRTAF